MSQKKPQKKADGKVGIMQRVFSFKRRTSTTQFDASAHHPDPETETVYQPELEIGIATTLGFHHEDNEDTYIICRDLLKEFPPESSDVPGAAAEAGEYRGTEDRTVSIFGVFDGHGGGTCSKFAAGNLHKYFANFLWKGNYVDLIGSALHHSFKETENTWCASAKPKNDTAGSCSLLVVLKGHRVFCGCAGDSKAIVFQQHKSNPAKPNNKVELNHRHGAELKSERERILAAGGEISPDGAVYGVLFPSRGFGDIDVKSDGKPVIIATPDGPGIGDWKPVELDRTKTSFMIVATDGLWDFVSDDTIMNIALSKPQKTPQQISEALCKEARLGGSEDDVTVITVKISYPSEGLGTVDE